MFRRTVCASLFLIMTAATTAAPLDPARAADAPPSALLVPWSGPYGGVPPFEQVRVDDFKSALEAGMAEQLAEVALIAKDPAPPSFENTYAALERSGRALDRAARIFGVYTSTLNDRDVQAVEREMAPRLAAHSDRITQNGELFTRMDTVYNAREHSSLSAEQQRLVWVIHTNFVRAGARLNAEFRRTFLLRDRRAARRRPAR